MEAILRKRASFLVVLLVISGCATTKVCPTASEEKVSMCRAEASCNPNFGQRYAASVAKQMGQLMANTQMCIANHIEAQKSNATLSVMERALPEQTSK